MMMEELEALKKQEQLNLALQTKYIGRLKQITAEYAKLTAETALRVELRAQSATQALPPLDFRHLTSFDSGFSADRNFLYHQLTTLERDLLDLQRAIKHYEEVLASNENQTASA